MNAILAIDKPAGMTSHDIVQRVRRITGERSVGHLGTLDPMATGVLPLLLGKYTRLAQFFVMDRKEYAGRITLGFSTDTYDADGVMTPDVAYPVAHLRLSDIQDAAAFFRGRIKQTPPPFSAKKISGTPAYKLARRGETVDIKPVDVEVFRFDVMDWDYPHGTFGFIAEVSSGTYLRSIAHDFGQMIQRGDFSGPLGGHLSALRRLSSGEFSLGYAVPLDRLDPAAQHHFISPKAVLRHMPNIAAAPEQLTRVRQGNAVNLHDFSGSEWVKVFDGDELVAIARRVAGSLFQPKVVLK